MPRIVRAQVALEVGEALRDAGRNVAALSQFSGEALHHRKLFLRSALTAQHNRLDTLVKSCRQAKNSYPNYPALRRALADAGDQAYDIREEVEDCIAVLGGEGEDHRELANRLLELGQRLKLLSFNPPDKEGIAANG